MTTDKMQPLDEGSDKLSNSEPAHLDPLTTVASAVSGGVAGATIGQFFGGRQGAAIGAVLGGVAGLAFYSEFSHSDEGDRHDSDLRSAEPSDPQAVEADRDRPDLIIPASTSASSTPTPDVTTEPITSHPEAAAPPFHLEQNYEISAETHYQLGVALGRQGKISEAIEEFQEALELAPDSAETHYNLGVALSKQGDTTQGLNHMQQARDLCLAQSNASGVRVIEHAIETLNAADTQDKY